MINLVPGTFAVQPVPLFLRLLSLSEETRIINISTRIEISVDFKTTQNWTIRQNGNYDFSLIIIIPRLW